MILAGSIAFGISAVSLTFGTLIAVIITGQNSRVTNGLITVSSGILISQLSLRLLPESVELGGWIVTIVGLLIGYLVYRGLENLSSRVFIIIPNRHDSGTGLRAAITISLAIALHNFPVGVAVGSTLVNNSDIAPSIISAMAIHAFPEGIMMGLPFVAARVPLSAMLLCITTASIPAGLGAWLGYQFIDVPGPALAVILGLAIGTMLLVALHEMIGPIWISQSKPVTIVVLSTGILVGMLLHF